MEVVKAGLALGVLGLLLGGCGAQAPAPETTQAPQTQERRYALRGVVTSIDRADQRIVVDHEDIPGFMAAMAMPYPVVEPGLLDVAAPGDQITADVVVTDTSARLANIVVVKKAEAAPPGGAPQQK
jgi:protein SCO1/2